MSSSNQSDIRRKRRMVRCAEGHIFDAAEQERCPTCGSPLAGTASGAGPDSGSQDDQTGTSLHQVPPPRPAWLKPALVGGAVILVALAVGVLLRGSPKGGRGPGGPALTTTPAREAPPEQTSRPPQPPQASQSPETSQKAPKPSQDATTPTGKPEQNPYHSGKVETWQTVLTIGGQQYVCVSTTQPDGHYKLGDGCPPPFAGETGETTIHADGSWVSRADSGRVDTGTIEVLTPDKFIAHTATGAVVWERVKSDP